MIVLTGQFDKCPHPPVPAYDGNRKRWRLKAWTFTRQSDKRAKRVVSGYFDSEAEAQEEDRVARSLDIGSILPLERIWKFERRTRDYKNVYIKLGEGNIDADDVDHKFIEEMVKNHKTHRNIVEIDRAFLHDN
ncbi:hypothetical protein B484DRAFT_404557 [Ochromonadaceae sp. CCMP2298]|nr:hypothetical protein B484DRAFT_404557 [Ochromonadaceae sp. CCMP2298]